MSIFVVLLIVGAIVWIFADAAGERYGSKLAELGRVTFFAALLAILLK